jgi:acetyl-CoA synthetase
MEVGGAHLGTALSERCERELGVVPNETYGQAEIRSIIGNSRHKWPVRPGSMGRPYPGHQVAIATPQGHPAPPGTVGEIVVNRYDIQGHPDPALFLGYWRGEEAGRPVAGTWHHTGDLARVDEDGYLWYAGRIEDVFQVSDAGQVLHTVVPDEVEAVLRGCPGVGDVAIVPSAGGQVAETSGGTVTAVVKAYVLRRVNHAGSSIKADDEADGGGNIGADGRTGSRAEADAGDLPDGNVAAKDGLAAAAQTDADFEQALIAYARLHLDAWQVPVEVEIIPALPLTVNGTVRRMALRHREEDVARKRQPVPAPPVPVP